MRMKIMVFNYNGDDGNHDFEKCLRPWQVFVACYVADCPRGRGFSEAGAETGTSPDVVIVVVVVVVVVLLLFIIIIR